MYTDAGLLLIGVVFTDRWLRVGRSCPSASPANDVESQDGGLALACDDDSLPLGASIRLIVVLYAISDIQ